MKLWIPALLAVTMLVGCTGDRLLTSVQAHRAEVDAWFADRLERLQAPDGWLSLVGLHWLDVGTHTLGAAADNDIILATGPDRLGSIELDATGTVRFTPVEGVRLSLDGQPVSGTVVLRDDRNGATPNVLAFADDRASLILIDRGGRKALRVRAADAATRIGFRGIARYPVDIGWRLPARFEAHPPGQKIPIATIINTIEEMDNPGAVVFEKDGKTFRLEAVDEGDGRLFLIFADRTNGRTTYGAGRFLYAEPVDADGNTVVDFNKAYNPPCALNAYSTCPLPPPENRLDLAITAGELKYAGPGH